MRICFVSRRFFPAISGMSAYALNLVQSLRDVGHDISVVSQYREPERENVYHDGPPQQLDGVRVVGVPQLGEGHGGAFEKDVDALRDEVLRQHSEKPFDLIHAQFAYPPGYASLLAARDLGLPCVVSIQGGDGHWFGTCCDYHREIMRTLLRGADSLIIGTSTFAEEVQENNDIEVNFDIIPGGTDTSKFAPVESVGKKQELRNKYNIPKEAMVILYHGRVDLRKGVLELLQAFKELLKDSTVIKPFLYISGVGPNEREVREYIDEHRMSESIKMGGYIGYADAQEVYQLSDIFCSPTYAEGFSNTIVEALASKLPVVSTSTIGVRDVLRNEETALLCPIKDSPALLSSIKRLSEDIDLCERMTTEGLREVREKWSWKVVSSQIVDVYQNAINAYSRSINLTFPVYEEFKDDRCRFRANPNLL